MLESTSQKKKDLGVRIDDKLKFTSHVGHDTVVARSLRSSIQFNNRLLNTIDRTQLADRKAIQA